MGMEKVISFFKKVSASIGAFFKKVGCVIGRFFKNLWLKFKALPTKLKIIYSGLCVVFLAVGGFAGYLASGFVFKNSTDYGAIGEDVLQSLEDDKAALYQKFQSLNTNDDLTKSFSPAELVGVSIEKFKYHDYVYSYQYGLVNAMGVNQSVRASSIKDHDNYFLEDISFSGTVSAARRFYQSNDEVKDYEGSNVNVTSASWSDSNCTTRNIEEHTKKWGKDLSRPIILIVSSKTTISGTAVKEGDTYKVSLSLDKDRSTIRYAKQMLSISPIQNPVYNSIDVQFILSKNLDLISYHSEEHYEVDMIMPGVASYGKLSEYFTYDEQKNIPDITTNITYNEGGSHEKLF